MFINERLFNDFLNQRDILWTGINFSKAKFTRQGLNFSQEMLQRSFVEWNILVISDQKKYDIRMSFRKPIMQYDLSQVSRLNKETKAPSVVVSHIGVKDMLEEEDVMSMCAGNTWNTDIQYALTFIVESFNAITKNAAIWVVIYHTATSEVALCEKFIKTPGGLGVRNYWARTFYNLLFDIKNHDFPRWENMVQGSLDEGDDFNYLI